MIRLRWPPEDEDRVRAACRAAGITLDADPDAIVDALLNRADDHDRQAHEYRRLAHDLGDALDELPTPGGTHG